MAKVSVIMSVYNGEGYLREAINSVLDQTFSDFDFIIVDDGSMDGTEKIIRSFEDERIRLIKNKKNIERASSRNRGIEQSASEYVAIIDSDDISLPTRLEEEAKFLDKNPEIGLVGAWCEVIDEDGEVIRICGEETTYMEIKKNLRKENQFCHSSVMFRKECVTKVGGYRKELVPAEDYDLWLRISEEYEVANIPKVLCKYRFYLNTMLESYLDQERHAELARKLADERKLRGEDSLQQGNAKSLEEISKSETLKKSWFESRKQLAYVIHNDARSLCKRGKSLKYRKFLKKSLLLYPLNLHALGFLLLSQLGINWVERAKRLKKRVQDICCRMHP